MSRWRSTDEVFDTGTFLHHVHTYMALQGLNYTDMSRLVGCGREALKEVLAGQHLSMWMACKLADVCDLSLDKYRREDGQRATRVA